MSRSLLHIAVFTALALAAPTIASGAKADNFAVGFSAGASHSGLVINIGDRHGRGAGWSHGRRGHVERGFRRHHRASPRRMSRFLIQKGAQNMEHMGYRGNRYRIAATSRRGWRKVYIFNAWSGEFMGSRRLFPVYARGHGRWRGQGIGFSR